ncbi:MAG: hypothetical protein AAF809_10110 [Bacteroidota bacterium]
MTEQTLHMEADLDKIKPAFETGEPRMVSFHAAPYQSEGRQVNLAINVRLENGDVYGMLDAVAENGGIGAEGPDGVYRFIPWPPAAIEVQDVL